MHKNEEKKNDPLWIKNFRYFWENEGRLKPSLDETKMKSQFKIHANTLHQRKMHISLAELYRGTGFGIGMYHEKPGRLGLRAGRRDWWLSPPM